MSSIGPLSPGTMASDSSIGNYAWSNPNNAEVSDGVYAVGITAPPLSSNYLKATNFGFTIPVGAIINGIVVEVQLKGDNPSFQFDNSVRIVKGGTIKTTDKSSAAGYPISETYRTYGIFSDLWGETWQPSDINASSFGFAFSYKNTSASSFLYTYVDHIRITVDYTALPTVTTQTVSSITQTTATGNGNVTDDGGATITERGTVYGSSANPTTADTKDTSGGTTGAFTTSIDTLTANTTYHVRAYAINSVGTSYGGDVSFTTDLIPPTITGVQSVTGVSQITF